jgi:hypothetical protein
MRRVRPQAVKKPKSAPSRAAGTARKIALIPTVMRSGAVRQTQRANQNPGDLTLLALYGCDGQHLALDVGGERARVLLAAQPRVHEWL